MQRRQAMVIGLGQFGTALSRSLSASDVDVLAVDVVPERVQAIAPFVSEAACFDAMDEDALSRTSPGSRDVCICAIGDEAREGAIIVTALLRQLGARRVIARTADELLERILRLVGAHEVVNPERAFGERLARRLLYEGILEEVPLGEDLVMSELQVPVAFVSQRLIDLELPKRFGLTVLGVRRVGGDAEHGVRIERPGPRMELQEGDILIVVGAPGANRQLMERLGE